MFDFAALKLNKSAKAISFSLSIIPILKPVFIHINIADELVTAQEQIEQLEQDLRQKENELAELKQELSEAEVRLEKLEGHKK